MHRMETPEPDQGADEQRGLGTDLAIGLGPTAAVIANKLLNRPPKPEPPKAEPPPENRPPD
jgi:hypothetical protein